MSPAPGVHSADQRKETSGAGFCHACAVVLNGVR